MNQYQIFIITYKYIIYASIDDPKRQNHINIGLIESTCAINDYLFVGCTNNTIEAYRIKINQISNQRTINFAHQSANERKASIVALSVIVQKHGDKEILHLLVSPLYGASKLYQVSPDLDAKLVFQLSKTFFGQTLTNALNSDQIYIAGTNKQVAVLNWNNNVVQTIGQDYEEGCGIFEIQIQDRTLLVRFETGKNFIFTQKEQTGQFLRAEHQLLGCCSAVNACVSRILKLNEAMILYCRDRFVTILDAKTFQNQEIASETGSVIYCVEKISFDKYVLGGDENEARILQIPFYYYLVHPRVPRPESVKAGTMSGQIPAQGVKQALDPTISALYVVSSQELDGLETLQSAIKKQHPDVDCVATSTGFSMRTQFCQNAFFPQINQISHFGGANLHKIIYLNKLDIIFTLSKSERSNEPTFKIIKYTEGRQLFELVGAFDDFSVQEEKAVVVDRLGAVSIIAGNQIISTKKIPLDFHSEVRVATTLERIFIANGKHCNSFNWELNQVSSQEFDDCITAIEVFGDKVVAGTENGHIVSENNKITQLSGKVDDIKIIDDQKMLLAIDVNGLATLFTIQ